jgi:hypothetical protein
MTKPGHDEMIANRSTKSAMTRVATLMPVLPSRRLMGTASHKVTPTSVAVVMAGPTKMAWPCQSSRRSLK